MDEYGSKWQKVAYYFISGSWFSPTPRGAIPIRFQESEIKLNPSTTTAKTFSDFPENVISDSSYTVV